MPESNGGRDQIFSHELVKLLDFVGQRRKILRAVFVDFDFTFAFFDEPQLTVGSKHLVRIGNVCLNGTLYYLGDVTGLTDIVFVKASYNPWEDTEAISKYFPVSNNFKYTGTCGHRRRQHVAALVWKESTQTNSILLNYNVFKICVISCM